MLNILNPQFPLNLLVPHPFKKLVFPSCLKMIQSLLPHKATCGHLLPPPRICPQPPLFTRSITKVKIISQLGQGNASLIRQERKSTSKKLQFPANKKWHMLGEYVQDWIWRVLDKQERQNIKLDKGEFIDLRAFFQGTGFDSLARTPRIVPLQNMGKAMVYLQLVRNARIAMASSRRLCGRNKNRVDILCKS